jgi:hypothetical protein
LPRKLSDSRQALVGAGLASISLGIVAGYVRLTVSPTSHAVSSAANEVIATFRVPHHALPKRWWAFDDFLRVELMCGGLASSRRSPLFPIFASLAAVAAVLTAITLLTGSHRLALVFPWRISVVLVPLATTILLAKGISALTTGLPRLGANAPLAATGLAIAVIGAVVIDGSVRQIERLKSPNVDGRGVRGKFIPLVTYVKRDVRPGDTYLVPTDMAGFRLSTGAPIFVDFKAHPHKDVEVLEWRRRLSMARRALKDGKIDCARLRGVGAAYRVNHVVSNEARAAPCRFLRPRVPREWLRHTWAK